MAKLIINISSPNLYWHVHYTISMWFSR